LVLVLAKEEEWVKCRPEQQCRARIPSLLRWVLVLVKEERVKCPPEQQVKLKDHSLRELKEALLQVGRLGELLWIHLLL